MGISKENDSESRIMAPRTTVKLKKLRVNYDEDTCMASLARVSAFFRLPSLLIFEAERIVDEDLYHLQGGPARWALHQSQPSNP